MHLMTPKCNDSESFKYSLLLYLYYYNITTNKTRVSQIDNNTTPHLSRVSQIDNNTIPHLSIRFNSDNDKDQFEDENKHIDLSIINIVRRPIFTTRNNATIKVGIVKIGNIYGIYKPSIECFNDNINATNEINSNKIKKFV